MAGRIDKGETRHSPTIYNGGMTDPKALEHNPSEFICTSQYHSGIFMKF